MKEVPNDWTEAQKRAYINHHMRTAEAEQSGEAFELVPGCHDCQGPGCPCGNCTEEPARNLITTEDGIVIDTETGEVLDAAMPEELAGSDTMHEGIAHWVIRTVGRLQARKAATLNVRNEAALLTLSKADAAMRALESDPEYIQAKAVIANCDKIIARADKGLDFFDRAWANAVGRYAETQMGKRERTWRTPWGSVSLRRVPAKLEVADETEAIATAKRNGWAEAVKETLVFSKLTKDVKAQLMEDAETAAELGFKVVDATEKVTIDGGVTA